MSTTLDARLAALRTARDAGAGRIPAALATEVDELVNRAAERRQRSPEHTVVGLFGATGSGKSSLVNALVGAEVARTHVRRPTTSEALAVTWGGDGASDLLDWLQVRSRVPGEAPIDARANKLILLDLPDFDSVEAANRDIAERLAAQVDALVWVVDPQKYADQVLHAQFIAPHARHGAVTIVVLNQSDLLSHAELTQVLASLRELIERDGIVRGRVLATSARTGAGLDVLRTAIGDLAAARAARESRLSADVATIAAKLPDAGTAREPASKAVAALIENLAIAAGVDVVAEAVAGSYRKRAGQATGWPVVSWILRFRADPLTRLGLGRSLRGGDGKRGSGGSGGKPGKRGKGTKGENPELHRTSLPALNAAAQARASLAVRSFADAAGLGLSETWRGGIRTAVGEAIDTLPADLDLAIARTVLPAKGSWWWVLFTIVQWVAILAALVGIGWLLAAALLPRFGMPAPEIIMVEGWGVPTLLIAGGIALGILLGLLGGILSAITAASRRRRARKLLVAQIAAVVRETVVAPVAVELARAREYSTAVGVARGR